MLGKLLEQSRLELATMSPLFNQLHTVIIKLHLLSLREKMQPCPKICTKYRKHWKNYVSFQLFWQTGPFLVVLKIAAILQKYPTFECFFFMLSWAKEVRNKSFFTLHYSVRNKKLIKIKSEKNVNFVFRMYFLG